MPRGWSFSILSFPFFFNYFRFLDQLTCPDKLEEYRLSVKVEAEMRGYQRAGVNWLAFLNRLLKKSKCLLSAK